MNYMIDHFSGWGYYRMTWSRVVAAQRVLADIQTAKALLAGSQLDPYYTPLIATLRSAGV